MRLSASALRVHSSALSLWANPTLGEPPCFAIIRVLCFDYATVFNVNTVI